VENQRQKEYKTVHRVLGLVFNDLNEQEKRVVILMTALDLLAKEINIDFKPFLIEAEELVNSHWDKWKQEAIDLEDIQKQIDDIFKDKKF
jgi:hypothetical protein